MPHLRFHPRTPEIEARVGESLLEVARRAGVPLESPCNGAGVCGKCLLRVIDGRLSTSPEAACRHRPPPGHILACQAEVETDAVLEIPRRAEQGLQIHDTGDAVAVIPHPWSEKRHDPSTRTTILLGGGQPVGVEDGDTTALRFGAAIDIGTTTLAVSVVELASGRELASVTGLNPQARFAQDVLGRIHFASEGDGLETLRRAVVDEINTLLASAGALAEVDSSRIYDAVLSGNTCMVHLALGRDPSALGRHPYTPGFSGHVSLPARAAGYALSPFGFVYAPPCISGYVGADLVSGVAATGLRSLPGVSLLVDVGTNGEMILARDGELSAASTAAGPAFEGMNISCGMRAAEGAVERFDIDDTGWPTAGTIGATPARGLCGSGLMDLVAELVRCGILEPSGRFARHAGALENHMERDAAGRRFRVADGVFLSQRDVRQVQLAKAAVRAGIDLLLRASALPAERVERVIVAGSFGYHLKESSLLGLGLLPAAFAGRIRFAGNTSKSGARAFLLNRELRDDAARWVAGVRGINLADHRDFQKDFVAAMAFPTPSAVRTTPRIQADLGNFTIRDTRRDEP